ncbi:MAG: thioredoxin domain-containing protein [Candidatus Magasanikbacteria bacterium]
MEEKNTSKSIFEVMSPQQTFVFGLVGGVMLLCTLGFFILLGLFLKGGDNSLSFGKVNDTANNPSVVDNNVNNAPSQPVAINVKDVDLKNDHIRGNKDAKITIIEFSDTECPFCKRFHETMQQVMEKYSNDVRWVYRNMPLDGLHQKARNEALALECANAQGKFWEFTDMVYDKTTSNDGLDQALLPVFAKEVGINVAKFNTCLETKQFASVVQAHEADGQAAGGQGTPYSVLIGPDGTKTAINGAYPYAQVEQMVKKYLN